MADDTWVAVPDSLELAVPYILREQGDWFEEELPFVRRLLEPGGRAIDIGANYGVYALSMARRVASEGVVWAFEPAPSTMRYLERSIERNELSSLRLHELALSNRDGSTEFHVSQHAELNSITPSPYSRPITVALRALDPLAAELGMERIDFIKIDAEGEEGRILEGGRSFFARESPLVMFELKHGRERNDAVLEAFSALGYALFRLVPRLGALLPLEPEPDTMLLNVFAAKPDRADALHRRGLLARPTAAPARPNAWRKLLQAPYGRPLFGSYEGRSEKPRTADYLRALDHFCSDGTTDDRAFHLQTAHDLLLDIVNEDASFARLLSLARVAHELGRRATASSALTAILKLANDPKFLTIGEPFLTTLARFETTPIGPNPTKWCFAQIIEARELFRLYSSFYENPPPLAPLQKLADLGFMSEGMQRRLSLMRQRMETRNRPG